MLGSLEEDLRHCGAADAPGGLVQSAANRCQGRAHKGIVYAPEYSRRLWGESGLEGRAGFEGTGRG